MAHSIKSFHSLYINESFVVDASSILSRGQRVFGTTLEQRICQSAFKDGIALGTIVSLPGSFSYPAKWQTCKATTAMRRTRK
jgi:hypothetical protein